MAKYGDLIRKARETDNQEDNKPENQISEKPESQINQQPEEEVNLCIKVPKSLRRHWAAEAGYSRDTCKIGHVAKNC